MSNVWGFDIDGTITSAPKQYARLATALRAMGDKVVIVTGHGTKQTRAELLDVLGFPYDDILVVDPKDDGSGKAEVLKEIDAWFLFDNEIQFGPEIIKVCPMTAQYNEPPGDKKAHKDAKKAAKALKGKRAITLVDGPRAGTTLVWHGLTDLISLDGFTYRADREQGTAIHVRGP